MCLLPVARKDHILWLFSWPDTFQNHLHLTVGHIRLEADFLQSWSWWAGDGGAAWLLPSSWNALAEWQAGAMPTGTTIVTAFLSISAFCTKGQGLTVDPAAHLPWAWEASKQ